MGYTIGEKLNNELAKLNDQVDDLLRHAIKARSVGGLMIVRFDRKGNQHVTVTGPELIHVKTG